ncbi:GAF domain-containing sensor histidine kinase [Tranquillimonas alkanivorans]|uniref:histidine kinase n=1 Tax=Tranquillimonas alkanivorans TaxID=441119 RepID=A0A1I5LLM3_9RHOB|nr:GAF domain-containing sensor histidine kinase [Tranquillimonas alkanivorans]SFO98063.1 GAF sensor signal transduction histidine kinase [Tranquillimonas alkanivorans]
MLNALADSARKLLGCPVGQVGLIERDEHRCPAVVGMPLEPFTRDLSFCAHALVSDAPLIVPDLSQDPRFRDNPLVAGEPHVRFYAGVPVILSSGFRVGTLCAIGFEAMAAPAPEAVDVLRSFAVAAAAALERPADEPGVEETRDDRRADFVALIGHELRTPLTVMVGSTRLFESRLEGRVERRLAQAAHRAADHLADLVEAIIAFADASTGDLSLSETPDDLATLLDEVLEMQGPRLDGSEKSVTVADIDLPGPVLLDAAQAKLALTALVENATLHGGGRLTLATRLDPDGHLEISVTDDGTLDDRVQLDQLYEPFVVGGKVDTREVGGLGLGLPLTRKIVELHGGEFEVRPEAHQTTAVIRLPAWRLHAVAAA